VNLASRLRAYVVIDNLLDADYEAALGFPALGRAARAGLHLSLGGDRTP
jgi:outer membrane cobalamin receptor